MDGWARMARSVAVKVAGALRALPTRAAYWDTDTPAPGVIVSTRMGAGMFMRPISTCWPSTCQVALERAICCCSQAVCAAPISWRAGLATAAVKPAASKPVAVK